MIKMIVLDLDGTLLNNKSKVTKESKQYLKKLKENGYIIVVASGRIYASIEYVLEDFDYINYVITDTGSSCYEIESNKTIFNYPIKKEDAYKITKYYNEECLFIDICSKDKIYKYSNKIELYDFIENKKDWNYIFTNCNNITHISLLMKHNNITELKEQIEKDINEIDVNIMQDSFSDKKWLEMIYKGQTKYKAINELASYLNINNDEIMAFGDGLNDIEMLKKCGNGVAMNNALEEVKENALYVTLKDHNNNGVIEFLKEYLNVY